MSLTNFGSVLNFAEELESGDQGFYAALIKNSACEPYKALFEELAADAQKNIKTVQRTRRENVTEMILEPITDFTREPFVIAYGNADTMKAEEALQAAQKLEERAERYYVEAAAKIKALPEVSRALKLIGKKRGAHRHKLDAV